MNDRRYDIVRFYAARDKRSKIVKRGLTLEQAQAHCRKSETHKPGVWFDGYRDSGRLP